ncbi:MAG: hypothetical protein ACK50P_23260 [Planctomycetaceae bacterium]
MVEQQREHLDDFLDDDSEEPVLRPRRPRDRSTGTPPTFVTVMAIIDLIFCTLRIPFLILSAIGIVGILSNPQLATALVPSLISVVAEALIAACGIVAGIGMLMKKPWASIPGWVAVVSCVISIGSNIFSTLITMDVNLSQFQVQQSEAARIGAYVGLVGTVLFRLVLLGCYIVALQMFTGWIGKTRTAEA